MGAFSLCLQSKLGGEQGMLIKESSSKGRLKGKCKDKGVSSQQYKNYSHLWCPEILLKNPKFVELSNAILLNNHLNFSLSDEWYINV